MQDTVTLHSYAHAHVSVLTDTYNQRDENLNIKLRFIYFPFKNKIAKLYNFHMIKTFTKGMLRLKGIVSQCNLYRLNPKISILF